VTVHLVGAGPGDPDLVTVRAARLLAHAEIVVYDRLAVPVLSLASPTARLIDVGKEPGRNFEQAEINRLIVLLGRDHEVVRLKGGDPLVFGRSGEEIDALEEAGVDYTIVPGISSVLASSAAACVPLTDRRRSAMCTLVTGHSCRGGETPRWRELAALGGTLVVLMGVHRRSVIAHELMEGGAARAVPVIAVERVSRPDERITRTTLGELPHTPLENPATLIVQLGSAPADGPDRPAVRSPRGVDVCGEHCTVLPRNSDQ
jgi:uroporphyrin-III C-methyltransferase